VQSSAASSGALVGNYNFAVPEAGVSMTNSSLYPGSPGRPTGSAPNIRSQLFINQIKRFQAFESAGNGAPHIPYVTRFNNWGNSALDSDGDPSNGFTFDTTAGSAHENQLPSRADFRVLAQTYRLLGADGLHVFESGVRSEGPYGDYTKQEVEADALAGWNLLVDSLEISGGTAVAADYAESQGVAWTSLANSRTLDVFVSNLSETSQAVALGTIAGRRVGEISGGTLAEALLVEQGHYLWTFERVRFGHGGNAEWVWSFTGATTLFTDPELLNRQGIGVPEPSAAILMAAGTGVLLWRRRRG
ncbi:MAG: PEP-CTERM sorting domain-containing protein, partial [Phycisphaeraceae bacterium]